jgi:O-antigen/teichoic acid export membrane protein
LGIIQKQSISGTIYSYLGVILGFVITALLLTHFLTTDEVGLLRVIVSYATLFAQFAGLGFTVVSVKMFPHFRDANNKHHGFLGLSLLIGMIGFVIAVIIYLLFQPVIIDQSQEKSQLFNQYFYYVIPLMFFTLLFNIFDTYYRVLYNAVKGIFYREVIQRIIILFVILIYYFQFIDFHWMVILYLLAMITPTLLLFISLIKSGQLHLKLELSFINRGLRNEMISVGFFSLMASFSGMLVMNIDILMINNMLGLSAAGIYTITFFFGTLILVPLRTMGKISSVVVAEAWKANDLYTIKNIYKKSSISLSVIGLLLFIGIWGNIDNVFHLIKPIYLPGKMVILFIGIANLFDIFLGVSSQIIVNSKYYKYLSYFLFGFAILIVLSNFLLIPVYGIVGAAIASMISKFIFNLVKYLFVYTKFKIQPFTWKFLLLIFIGIGSYWISTFIPVFSNFIIDIIIRSAVILIVFMVPVYAFSISNEINERIENILSIIRKQ